VIKELPDQILLPAHGPVAPSTHRRADELLTHHDRRLDACAAAVAAGASTGLTVAERLTWTRRERRLDELDPYNQMLAILETAAHLTVLESQGRVRGADRDGVREYQG
jgi:glyoxylase-like metal-dependent hydrolase (beta-lactamase superfamily II)